MNKYLFSFEDVLLYSFLLNIRPYLLEFLYLKDILDILIGGNQNET